MTRSVPIAVLGLAFIIFGMVRADAASPTAGKIGFVDLQRTLQETAVGKKAAKKFETDKKKKQAELDKLQQDFQDSAKELEKQRSVLKPEVLLQRQRELEKRYVEVQQTYAKLERDLAQAQTQLIQGILKQTAPVIQKVAEDGGYAMIVDRSAVLWASEAVDVTAQVNSQLK